MYISQVELDESTKTWAMNVGIPVKDKSGKQTIGVLRGTVNVSVVFDTLSKTAIGETGHAALLDKNGIVLYARNSDLLMKEAPAEIKSLVEAQTSSWRSDLMDLEGNPAVVAVDYMDGEIGKALGWVILFDQDLSEVNAVAREALFRGLLVSAIIALLLGTVAILFARSITKPMEIVTRQAWRMASGDIADDDAVSSGRLKNRGDEIGDLVSAFQELNDYFKQMAYTSQRLAAGDLTVQIQSRGEKDQLGNAFVGMVDNLRKMIKEVASNASRVKTPHSSCPRHPNKPVSPPTRSQALFSR